MFTRRALGLGGLGLGLLCGGRAQATASSPRLDFRTSVLGDYLHLLIFREAKPRLPTFQHDSLPPRPVDIPMPLYGLAEFATLGGVSAYTGLVPFMRELAGGAPDEPLRTDLDRAAAVLAGGAAAFPAFEVFWRAHLAGPVQAQIDAWREQDAAFAPMDRLVRLHRLPPIRAAVLSVVAMPFHPSATGTVSPLGVYSSLSSKPNLPWFLGHEGTHLLWSEGVGAHWTAHPWAERAAAAARPHDLDLEEMACLLMQVALAQDCQVTPADYRISAAFPDGPRKQLLAALEAGWATYAASPDRWPTLIDYVLETALATLA